MNKEFEVINLDMGDCVLCDSCGKDFTDLPDSGGFLFMSNAICPDCAENYMKGIKRYKEEKYIKGHCPKDVSFCNWVKSLR